MMTKTILFVLAFLLALEGWGGLTAHADTRCARIENGEVIEYRVVPETDLAAENGCWPDAKHKGVEWKPAPLPDTLPSVDSNTQVLVGPVVTIEEDRVVTSYSVRQKTTAELDGEKDAKLDSLGVFILKTLCDHENRIRVLERKSEITPEQCRAAIKAQM
jgi:hypothetical protein